MGDVAVGKVLWVRLRMKRVSGRVYAHKSHAFVDRVEQLLLSFRGHRGLAIRAQSRQVAGREKNYGGVLMKLLFLENPSVFRHTDMKTILGAQGRHRVVDDTGLSLDSLHHVVFKARGLRK